MSNRGKFLPMCPHLYLICSSGWRNLRYDLGRLSGRVQSSNISRVFSTYLCGYQILEKAEAWIK